MASSKSLGSRLSFLHFHSQPGPGPPRKDALTIVAVQDAALDSPVTELSESATMVASETAGSRPPNSSWDTSSSDSTSNSNSGSNSNSNSNSGSTSPTSSPDKGGTADQLPRSQRRPTAKGKGSRNSTIQRRRSMFAMLGSIFPTLTTPPATDDPLSAAPRRNETLRKPLPNPPPSSYAPALAIDDYGNPIHHPQPGQLPHSVPAAPLHAPPPVPGATPASHSRTSSFPTTLKKQPKMAPAPAPVQLQMAVTSPPRNSPRESRRGSSPVKSQPPGTAKLHSNRLRPVSPSPARGRSSSAQPPKVRQISVEAPRVASGPAAAVRPSSADGGDSEKVKKRRSWLPGGRSRANSNEMGGDSRTGAWIITPDGHTDYNTSLLLNGEKVRPHPFRKDDLLLTIRRSQSYGTRPGPSPSTSSPRRAVMARLSGLRIRCLAPRG
jgi:hypothetical protein